MDGWAIDLGNSNTRVARWDSDTAAPALLELPAICRQPGGTEPLSAPRLVPSATEIISDPTWLARLGRRPFLAKRWLLGNLATIGRPALERSVDSMRPGFVPAFKPYLERESTRTLTRLGSRTYSARDVARLFLRELLAEIKEVTGVRIRDLVLTTPVEAFETYRAELSGIANQLGVRQLRFIDEPVAAALGYGLSLGRPRLILVVDFGAGTLDFALVSFSARDAEGGTARVIAKRGDALGGKHVDQWLLGDFSKTMGYGLEDDDRDEEGRLWRQFMLAEARRVKEALFFQPTSIFQLTPPDHLRSLCSEGMRSDDPWMEVTRDHLVSILEENQVYDRLEKCLDDVLEDAVGASIGEDDIEEVLMVGGSSLLPGVYPFFEKRFGRDRVRAWQPFQAVAYGACAFASRSYTQSDFIVHDYAIVTFNPKTHEKEYTVIVPKGTRFPTKPDLWCRQMVPTCALGEPESIFKLVICELGRDGDAERKFMWDENGRLHRLDEESPDGQPVVVPLNESNPTLGHIDPPHSPSETRPRLEVSFHVNSDRWLCSTVVDLKTRRTILDNARVVRLV